MAYDTRHDALVFIILYILCYGKFVPFPGGVFRTLIKILILAGRGSTLPTRNKMNVVTLII